METMDFVHQYHRQRFSFPFLFKHRGQRHGAEEEALKNIYIYST